MPSTLSSQFRQKCAIYLRNRAPTKSSQPGREIAVNTSDLLPSARQQFAEIAKRILCVKTLETRNSDPLDFHDTAVWSISAAPEAAYLACVTSAKSGATRTRPGPLAIRGSPIRQVPKRRPSVRFPTVVARHTLPTLPTKSATACPVEWPCPNRRHHHAKADGPENRHQDQPPVWPSARPALTDALRGSSRPDGRRY